MGLIGLITLLRCYLFGLKTIKPAALVTASQWGQELGKLGAELWAPADSLVGGWDLLWMGVAGGGLCMSGGYRDLCCFHHVLKGSLGPSRGTKDIATLLQVMVIFSKRQFKAAPGAQERERLGRSSTTSPVMLLLYKTSTSTLCSLTLIRPIVCKQLYKMDLL